MAIVYYLTKSRVVSFNAGKLAFNVLNVREIPASQKFEVNWNEPTLVAPKYSDPTTPQGPDSHLDVALSERYCLTNGIPMVQSSKRPDYLDRDAPPGGWLALDGVLPKKLTLETHDGGTIDLLDDALVLPGSLRWDGSSMSLAISEAARAGLGLGELPPYEQHKEPGEPFETPTDAAGDRARMRALFEALANLLR